MIQPKYRAWDKYNKKMYPVVSIEWRNGVITKAICTADLNDPTKNFAIMAENLVLMQYTGNTDKVGVEIYELDYIKDGKLFTLVEWDKAGLRYYSVPGTTQAWVNLEVAGNKFEGKKKDSLW